MSTELIAKKTIEMEDSIISKISYTDLAVYKFIQEQFESSDVSQNLIFQYVYCKYYTLDLQKVDDLFIKGYFELMQSLKGTKNIDMESLLFKVYGIETKREKKLHYSFTSKLAHTIDNNIPIWDSRIAKVFSEFYQTIVSKNKLFWAKNDSRTIWGEEQWIKTKLDDKKLDEESYRSFLKSYGPDWDMRFGVYYEDGWHYVYRSNFLLKKFKFQKQDDGFYHVIESYTTEKGDYADLIEEVLWQGYFKPPYNYKGFVRGERTY